VPVEARREFEAFPECSFGDRRLAGAAEDGFLLIGRPGETRTEREGKEQRTESADVEAHGDIDGDKSTAVPAKPGPP
jgi:hypothetical protein